MQKRHLATCFILTLFVRSTLAQDHPAPLPVKNSNAKTEKEMKRYTELIEHTVAKIDMVPIPSGQFVMGSSESEKGRSKNEGPQHKVKISPFWMSKCEITWDAYEIWMSDLDIARREAIGLKSTKRDAIADPFQLSQPTPPYTDMSFGMGKRGYPAICMTQHAARTFCKWLTAKTGRYYRLPTEAEWEYACRAGTTTAYHFGDDPAKLDEYAWHKGNTEEKYARVGKKKPNAWGLHDMHGNVSEWVLDQFTTDFYGKSGAKDPLAVPLKLFPRVVRGGGWKSSPLGLRSAVRVGSTVDWKEQDPQVPQSIWYHTDALDVGFRIVRPLVVPSDKEKAEKWDKSLPIQKDEEEGENE